MVRHDVQGQGFACHQSVGSDQPARGRVPAIAALLANVVVETSHILRGRAVAVLARDAATQAALGDAQGGQHFAQPAQGVDLGTVRARQQMQQPDSTTNGVAGTRCGLRRGELDLNADVPRAAAAVDDTMRDRCTCGQRAVEVDRDLTHVLHVHQRPARVVEAQFTAIAVFNDHLLPLLIINVPLDRCGTHVARCANSVPSRPQRRQPTVHVRKCFPQVGTRLPVQSVHDLVHCQRRGERRDHMTMIGHTNQVMHVTATLLNIIWQQCRQAQPDIASQNRTSVCGTPTQVVGDGGDCVSRLFSHSKLTIPQPRKETRRIPHPAKAGGPML